jgi:hypothetical protein
MPAFQDIEFGFADAHKEATEAPALLLRGFLDDGDLIETALGRSPFLFLGYKGSGKTASAERARLLAQTEPQLFVVSLTLDDFSYGDFKALAGGTGDFQTRYPTAWAWNLLLFLLQSLEDDEAAKQAAPPEYTRVVRGLQELDLLPLPELKQLVTRSGKRSFKLSIPKFFELTRERVSEGQDLQMLQMVQVLRRAIMEFPATSRHVIFVDGLDDVFTQKDLQFQALSALIGEASKLNNDFRAAGKPFKIVVECRTDIFDKLPGANKNKIRQDGSVALDWYDDPRDPDRTRLVKLVNLRAALSLGCEVNVFEEFFPATVDGRPSRRYVLDHTRHQPRDVLQLMKSIQRFAPAPSRARLSEAEVKSGIRDYSNQYFLPELRDELHGYLDPAHIDTAVALLSSLGTDRFTVDELEAHAIRLGLNIPESYTLVSTLFECSGVGMLEPREGRPFYTFKYRNRNAMLIPGRRLVVHLGAHKALNIERTPRPRAPRGRGRRATRPGARKR